LPYSHLRSRGDRRGISEGGLIVDNVKTIQEIYAAFGAGDIPAILAKLSADVDWEYGQGGSDVPWLQSRRGRDAVGGFFAAVADLEFHKFAPKEIIDGPNVVVALIDVDFTVKKTGKRVTEEDEIHVWRFNDAGEVVRFRHGADTQTHAMAWRA
jgi:ketosteroid isomerase-like protein